MTKLNQRGDLNAAALGIYIPILAGAIFAVFHHGITKSTGFAFVVLFCLIKLVGAAMSVDVQLNDNADLYTPAAILSTVVLSPLLLATAHFMKSSGTSSGGGIGRYGLLSLPRITQLMIIASLALGIVGGLDAFATVPTNIKTGQLYLRIAAGISVGSWLLIGVSLFTKWSERQYMNSLHKALFPVIGGIIMPLLGLRLVYTCGIAITIDTTMNQEFNALTGSWVLYLCVAWLPEIFIGAAYVAVGIMAPRTLEYTGLAENRAGIELV